MLLTELDKENKGKIFLEEWIGFWNQVHVQGHSSEEMLDELQKISEGDSWDTFNLEVDTVSPTKLKTSKVERGF